ncbi:hypothetical protein ACWEGE_15685 [Amycolatopsis sp. NPDC004747]
MNKVSPKKAQSSSGDVPSALAAVSMPWVFTQRDPLKLSDFISEAKRRGYDLDDATMRELYRHGLLVPFVAIYDRRVEGQSALEVEEPIAYTGTLLTEIRKARSKGAIEDLQQTTFKPRLPFARGQQRSSNWWNGLIYSWHQLQCLPALEHTLSERRQLSQGQRIRTTLPKPDWYLLERAIRFRRIAIMATALEARYLPNLDPERLHFVNVSHEIWDRYRAEFDPVTIGSQLGYSGEQAYDDAEYLLEKAQWIDPIRGAWSSLIRRAPRSSWRDLKDNALLAMDMRETAEILLRFREDLAGRDAAEPLPATPSKAWHPLTERLTYRRQTLDQDLVQVGLSPHPRVVLAIEGESEQVHVPRVWSTLGYPNAPELMRVLNLRGADRDLEKVAALAAAPLVGERRTEDYWELIKPPTCLMVAVDPEGSYFAPQHVEKTRANILTEIKLVLRAQGAATTDEELDHLVKIFTWTESCYEFTHFTDAELADGIRAIHQTCDGLSRDELIDHLAEVRARRGTKNQKTDIKNVWGRWSYKPSKVELAEQLWPVLEGKIKLCMTDASSAAPEIAEIVQLAHMTAQHWRYYSFVLTAV